MSPIVSEWLERAKESAEAKPLDRIVYRETPDPRVSYQRRVVVGGVVDGRRGKPGVILVALTSDGDYQEMGVSHVDQARAVIEALSLAWPELHSEKACGP